MSADADKKVNAPNGRIGQGFRQLFEVTFLKRGRYDNEVDFFESSRCSFPP